MLRTIINNPRFSIPSNNDGIQVCHPRQNFLLSHHIISASVQHRRCFPSLLRVILHTSYDPLGKLKQSWLCETMKDQRALSSQLKLSTLAMILLLMSTSMAKALSSPCRVDCWAQLLEDQQANCKQLLSEGICFGQAEKRAWRGILESLQPRSVHADPK